MQFRAARKASEEVSAQIVLGDRPIEITVRRDNFLLCQVQMTSRIWAIQNSIWMSTILQTYKSSQSLQYDFIHAARKGMERADMDREVELSKLSCSWNNVRI